MGVDMAVGTDMTAAAVLANMNIGQEMARRVADYYDEEARRQNELARLRMSPNKVLEIGPTQDDPNGQRFLDEKIMATEARLKQAFLLR